jgi:hypothetical protein
MKWFQQQGQSLKRTHLQESGNICTCCEDFNHAATEARELHDDAECPHCNSLCCCSCHRDPEMLAKMDGKLPSEREEE